VPSPFEIALLEPIALVHIAREELLRSRSPEVEWIDLWGALGADGAAHAVALVAIFGEEGLDLTAVGPKAAHLTKPVVLGFDGNLRGSAHELLTQADAVVASTTSSIGPPDSALTTLDAICTRQIPYQELSRLLLLDGTYALSIARAQELGLIEIAVPSLELEAATIRAAGQLCR
jgi:enoyl-CoA hydratase/carnithine racemase